MDLGRGRSAHSLASNIETIREIVRQAYHTRSESLGVNSRDVDAIDENTSGLRQGWGLVSKAARLYLESVSLFTCRKQG
jgi:hypothetical protein